MADLDDLRTLLELYLREVTLKVREVGKQGGGAEVLGSVPGRPEAEDLYLGIDRVCEEILENTLRSSGLRLAVHSEHGSGSIGAEGTPEYLVASDPFDGTGLFRRGLPAEWWSVVTLYHPNGTPALGGAADILRGEIYLAGEGGVEIISSDGRSRAPGTRAGKTALDDDTVLAAYLMDPSYLVEWVDRMRGPLAKFPGVRLWPNGGSCIYPWLARGLVHAYVMFNEPRSEIDPGLAFAWAAKYPLFSVREDGTLDTYQFVPGKQAERVPFYVAACTEALAEDVVNHIIQR